MLKTIGRLTNRQKRGAFSLSKKTDTMKSVDVREQILDVARELMVENGIKETSLKDIAKAAKISTGTLYYHYSAKEDLIHDIAKRNMRQITSEFLSLVERAKGESSPLDIVARAVDHVLDSEMRGKLHLYLINNAITSGGPILEDFREQYSQWRLTLEFGLGKVFPASNNDVRAYMVLALLDGLIIQKMLGAKDIPAEEMLKILLSK